MKRAHPRTAITVLVLLGALAALTVAAPLAAAAPRPQKAPLSKAFKQYRANPRAWQVLSPDGFLAHSLGLLPSPVDASIRRGESRGPSRVAAALAPSYNLGDEGRLTAIRDQNPYGTCWAFGAYSALESGLLSQAVPETRDFSEDHLVLTSGFYNASNPYNYGGYPEWPVAYLTRWSGPIDQAGDTYGDGKVPSPAVVQKHVQDVHYIKGGTSGTDTSRIKQAILDYGAVTTEMYYQAASYSSTYRSYYLASTPYSNHMIAIVGWDDSFPSTQFTTTAPGDGAWLVRNNWGGAWGDGGYFWVSYYDAILGRSVATNYVFPAAEPADNYARIYQYDPLGQVNSVGYSSPTAWAANVFTAAASENIVAAGFYTDVAGAGYTLYTAPVTGTGTPGTLTPRATGTMTEAGFHTVDFSDPLSVTKGGKFAVVVELTTPGWNYPIAFEYRVSNYSPAATAASKQSYIRSSSTAAWSDFTRTVSSTGNVCLKAYAGEDLINDPPVAANDSATTAYQTSVTVSVLANDTDPEGAPLSIASVTQPANGTAVANANSTITYTPNTGFSGSDTFTYIASDGVNESNAATVTITVRPAVVAGMKVQSITLSLTGTRTRRQVKGIVKITDQNGANVRSARVYVTWSGLVSGSASALTGTAGTVTFTSSRFSAKGTVTLTVTNVVKSGVTYVPGSNLVTQASIVN